MTGSTENHRIQAAVSQFNEELLAFIAASPTPFHAVENMASRLIAAGFEYLAERDYWNLSPGGRYFTTRNGSSIVAFTVGRRDVSEQGLRLVGAHTDSPCLSVKPQPDSVASGYFKLGVEVYGGALLAPWFDRDLSIAGRLVYRNSEGSLETRLVNFEQPVAVIPSLAIHLDRQANDSRTINPQTDIPPVLFQKGEGRSESFNALLAERFLGDLSLAAQIVDYELFFYDTQKPAVIGAYDDFLASARLDNLLSCHVGLQALLAADGEHTAILVCNDHEEVGSASACGAQGPMLASVLERLIPEPQLRTRVIGRSLMVSADNAHGVHPNFAAKHDENHGPLLNRGPVIKVNSKQRYATNSLTAAAFKQLAHEVDVNLQSFVTRSDMGCGSTIGPITATEIGVPTIDVGVPTFAMHSVRELAGTQDAHALLRVLRHFFNKSGLLLIE